MTAFSPAADAVRHNTSREIRHYKYLCIVLPVTIVVLSIFLTCLVSHFYLVSALHNDIKSISRYDPVKLKDMCLKIECNIELLNTPTTQVHVSFTI